MTWRCFTFTLILLGLFILVGWLITVILIVLIIFPFRFWYCYFIFCISFQTQININNNKKRAAVLRIFYNPSRKTSSMHSFVVKQGRYFLSGISERIILLMLLQWLMALYDWSGQKLVPTNGLLHSQINIP